jgi:hypothetical protein
MSHPAACEPPFVTRPSFLGDPYVTAAQLVASTAPVVSNLTYSGKLSVSGSGFGTTSCFPLQCLPFEDDVSRLVRNVATFIRRHTSSHVTRQEPPYWSSWERHISSVFVRQVVSQRLWVSRRYVAGLRCDDIQFAWCVLYVSRVFVLSLLSLFWKRKRRLTRSPSFLWVCVKKGRYISL